MKHLTLACVLLMLSALHAQPEALPDGLKALQHPDPDVRYRAIELLQRLGKVGKFAIPQLREALDDKNAFIRLKAAEALWEIERPKAITLLPIVQEAMRHRTPLVRVRAARVLGMMKEDAADGVPWLIKGLRDDDLEVKMECIQVLGDLGPTAADAAPSLMNLSKEDDFFLVEPLVGAALGNLGVDAIPILRRGLKDTPAKKRLALFALGSMGPADKNTIAGIVAILGEKDAVLRGQAALALAKIGGSAQAAVTPLRKVLAEDDDPKVKLFAAHALWVVEKSQSAMYALTVALENPHLELRLQACRFLRQSLPKNQTVVVAMAKRLKDAETSVKLSALETLGAYGAFAKNAQAEIKPLLSDPDAGLRLSAALSWWQITQETKETLAVFEAALATQDVDVRRQAYSLSASMGMAARPLIPSLLKRWMLEGEELRPTLASALRSIDPEEAAKAGIR